MVQQQYTGTAYEPSALPLSGEITGWFGRTKARLFGKRDPVEAQLRDIARQGTFGAAISHFFATLLIVLFSVASLIALGADSFEAVLRSLSHGAVDIPNAVATGVTALLVPCMDVAMLRAASKIRLLATRRATRSEMALHNVVVGGIAVIEAGTYCYMAARYEHPIGLVAWFLISARAVAAPLIGVYLAMDRAHPPTSRDILAQVELGAGVGVIRDVTEIANDPTADLDQKMELFGASAVMRESERERLESLINVARRHSSAHTTAVARIPSARIVAASSTLPPETPPTEHHASGATDTYKAMHDWDIPDEVEYDGVDSDPLGYQTAVMEAIDLEDDETEDIITSHRKRSTRTAKDSRPKTSDQRSKIVAKGHKTRRDEEQRSHKRLIRDTAFNILDARRDQGMTLDEVLADAYAHPVKLADEIQDRALLSTRPSAGTARRQINPWYASRSHRKADRIEDEVAPMEPQELRELVATEAW